ncbi:hypothetical protein FRC02_008842 [Tulasnella sp. 418]|nr:hypothetical protein FRC02_008842 [Tulasnella sp. 418]
MALELSTVGVRRTQNGGSRGRNGFRVITNNFAITLDKASVFYHYDEIEPVQTVRRNFQVIERLQLKHSDKFNPRGAYDGRKNLYMSHHFGDHFTEDDVFGNEERQSNNPISVRLVCVNTINSSVLDYYLSGQTNITPDGINYLTAMNIVTRMGAIMKFGRAADGSATSNSKSIYLHRDSVDIGGGLEAWRGYRPSVRPGFGCLYLNLGVTVGVVYQAGDLISLCLQWLKAERGAHHVNVADLAHLDTPTFGKLNKFLRHLKVITNHRKSAPNAIHKLTQKNADSYTFEKDGQLVSISQYYSTTYGKRLRYPNLPCVVFARDIVLPLELLDVVPGQLLQKSKGVKPDQTRKMMDFAKQNPDVRLRNVKNGFSELNFEDNDYTRNSKISIDPRIHSTEAHMLQAPRLQYRNSRVDPLEGKWNVTKQTLFGPKTVRAWGAAIFDGSRPAEVADFMRALARDMAALGMTVPTKDAPITSFAPEGDTPKNLFDFARAVSNNWHLGEAPDLIICVLPERADAVRNDIKRFGDIAHGIATQIVVGRKMKDNMRRDRPGNQYNNNVALKINSKLGGENWVAHADSVALLKRAPTLVMGADVSHPAPGSTGPSVAAVVCSVSGPCTQYTAECRVQDAREETIIDLAEMVKTLIYRTPQSWGPNIKQILFFRDGLSEGQFDAVMGYERDAIKASLMEIYRGSPPKLTYIVVGKRHHMRMFPENPRHGDKSGNCKSGTVVDTEVCNPYMQDYYLLSHAGLLGTSRPSHYSVLHDENGLSAEQLQSTSYALCHIYARATRSVSIPAPVYYADKVASRFAFHFAEQGDLEVDSTMSEEQKTEHFKSRFKAIHQKNLTRMYWM